MRNSRGFSLLELLVVIGILALLVAILVPSLATARSTSKRTACLAQFRALEQAHWMYMSDNDGRFIHVTHSALADSWITTLAAYYGKSLITRSPVDASPYWAADLGGDGTPVIGTTDKFRRSSYAVNNFLTGPSSSTRFTRINEVPRPFLTVHFVFQTMTGSKAAADHIHVNTWWDAATPELTPQRAATEMALNAHGGLPESWKGMSNYGFLDGHAETLRFEDVFASDVKNLFDPNASQ